MKKANNIRSVSAFLCALLAVGSVMVSCGDAPAGTVSETQPVDGITTETEAVTEEEKIILDALPADLDMGGKVIRMQINEFDQTQYNSQIFMTGPDAADGDIVHDAILERNQMVEDRLNVSFTYETVNNAWDKVYSPLQKMIMAGDDVYDLIVDQQYGMLKVSSDNMFYNLMKSTVNDFSQNYWWNDYMDQLQLGADARYIFAGDYFLDIVETSSAIFFNKALYEADYESCDELYDLAFEGKWTIEQLGKYVKEYYTDVNGDGKVNEGDIFSMNLSRNYMDAQCFGCGIDFIQRDKDGLIVLDLNQEKHADLMQIITDCYFTPKTTFNYATVSGVDEATYYQNQRKAFANRQMLFLNDYLAAVKDLRDMKDDYGILPIPKLDESIENYRSVSHDTALVGAIPTTCGEPEKVCMVLEALCSMSHNTSMKTYFESAMKVKYARDEKSSQMIDLLHDSITTCFAYAYSSQINDYHEIFRTLFDSKKGDYASAYAKKEKTINKKFNALIENYLANKDE